jgi:Holliday junction resolvase RusA-like endonuclease
MQIVKKIKPLSVNQCWQGKRFKTQIYKNYESELLYTLPAQILPSPPYEIFIEIGFSNKASDLDNVMKPLLDILQKKYGFNDKEIYKMDLTKLLVPKGEEYFKIKMQHYKLLNK